MQSWAPPCRSALPSLRSLKILELLLDMGKAIPLICAQRKIQEAEVISSPE
jgi:hypothetical protein